jgi:peptidoglycan-associated lipoprotein
MPNKKIALVVCLILSMALLAPGCKKKGQVEATPEPAETQPVQTPEPSATDSKPPVEVEDFDSAEPDVRQLDETATALNERGVLKTIYFAFDKSELTESARATLRQNANWLKANPDWGVVIEGHCDERGTIEYNLALGQRRASSVRDYLSSLGVESSRIRTVSFGEERPADPGHNEAAWAKNRRAESKVEER